MGSAELVFCRSVYSMAGCICLSINYVTKGNIGMVSHDHLCLPTNLDVGINDIYTSSHLWCVVLLPFVSPHANERAVCSLSVEGVIQLADTGHVGMTERVCPSLGIVSFCNKENMSCTCLLVAEEWYGPNLLESLSTKMRATEHMYNLTALCFPDFNRNTL